MKETQNRVKEEKNTIAEYHSELRQDIVTGDWVVIATGRSKRPDEFALAMKRAEDIDRSDPFEHPEESGQEKDILIYRLPDGDWSVRVFPNKYPAFTRGRAVKDLSDGPYFAMSGVGYHELIVTRDPVKSLALLPQWQVAEVFDAYQSRYLELMTKKSVKYIQIFHNHGKEAGASIVHPHSQLMAIPVISPYIHGELNGAELYYRSHRRKVYQVMVDREREEKTRIVYENQDFIAFCPFASRSAFEIWVTAKHDGSPYFERITDEQKFSLAEVFQKSLFALHQGLSDPAYNFYVHTAPCDGKDYHHYQWHIEILPKTATWAGFELSTGIEVSTIEPEKAAAFLREQLA